jgi:hypothetical protein
MMSTLKLYQSSTFWRSYSEASDRRTPPSTLAILAQSCSASIRRQVAENISTPEYVLSALKNDQSAQVRGGLASRADLTLPFFQHLANDKSDAVKLMVLMNPSAPDAVIAQLIESPSREIANVAKEQLELLSGLIRSSIAA